MTATDSNEVLSAFVDGELQGSAQDRIVDALYEDPQLGRTWERYHLIGDAVRRNGPFPGAGTIAQRVNAALSTEPAVVRLKPRRRRPVLRPLAGLAMAAAIAGVAVVGIHSLDDAGQPPPVAVASRPAPGAAAPAPTAPEPSGMRVATVTEPSVGAESSRMQWSDVAPAAEARLNAYLVSHNEYAGIGVGGVLPYARIVGYESFAEDGR